MSVLTHEQRAQILQGSGSLVSAAVGTLFAPSAGAISSAALASGAGVGTAGAIGSGVSAAIGGLAGSILLGPIVAGIAASLFDPEFPQLSPGDIARAAHFVGRIKARGLEPVVTSDPFTGNVALATEDQLPILNQLLAEAAVRNLPQPSSAPTFAVREQLIEALSRSAVERGFFASTSDIPADLRGGVFRPTADSPLQFIQTGGRPL